MSSNVDVLLEYYRKKLGITLEQEQQTLQRLADEQEANPDSLTNANKNIVSLQQENAMLVLEMIQKEAQLMEAKKIHADLTVALIMKGVL
ncbi:hypothetical protein M670_00125 [Schinkia azotoformans MEV2011]|uniref:Uncharacterized protein n=1 Tax=Schinkia azotoformans MEV2011 TaxID=1348973 RepID=A0A072P3T9_SCHAZ|nr:hypothetical protein [Schinkia azotoformans]KEF40110.1 hypothetical protein M670_00125 [Schinkia azotoformans MEV2011]